MNGDHGILIRWMRYGTTPVDPGGVTFVIGGSVNDGIYGERSSLRPEDHLEGDIYLATDFRSTYATILNRWLLLDPIVHGDYEQFAFL